MSELVYLASPYSHLDPEVMERRFLDVCKVAAKLMSEGVFVFCPIAHTHPMAVAGNLPREFDFWEKYDRVVLGQCKKLIVVKMPGWDISKGVQAEINIATEIGIPVEYMEWIDDVRTPVCFIDGYSIGND